MLNLANITVTNNVLWKTCVILPNRYDEVFKLGQKLNTPSRVLDYKNVFVDTDVPWWVVAIIDYRESDCDRTCSIAQGDPWNKVSRHTPRGRGPFKSWHDTAVDALIRCAPFAAKWKDWSPGGTLTLTESYNGFGYEEYHHETSPYNWGATNHEERGKYEEDGKYNPAAWDNQIGCAAILKVLMKLNDEVRKGLTTNAQVR